MTGVHHSGVGGGLYQVRVEIVLRDPCSNCGAKLKLLINTVDPIYAYCIECGLIRGMVPDYDGIVQHEHLPGWIDSGALAMFEEKRERREQKKKERELNLSMIDMAFEGIV